MDEKTQKDRGKFVWFCVGTILGLRGIPKLIHFIYITAIIILLGLNISQAPDNFNKLTNNKEEVTKLNKEIIVLQQKNKNLNNKLLQRDSLVPTCMKRTKSYCNFSFKFRENYIHYRCSLMGESELN